MIVLGLDPSLTNFGWALHDTEAEGAKRAIAKGRFQTSRKDLFIDRYTDLRSRLGLLIKEHQPDRISCEYPVFGEIYSEGMYGLFLFTCEAIRKADKDVVFFSPGQLKAHARFFLKRPEGWDMKKPDMVEAAQKNSGGKGRWNHNEADAYWASVAGGRFWSLFEEKIPLDSLSPVEKSQFTKIHTFKRGKKAGKTVQPGILFREDERFFQWSKR